MLFRKFYSVEDIWGKKHTPFLDCEKSFSIFVVYCLLDNFEILKMIGVTITEINKFSFPLKAGHLKQPNDFETKDNARE